MKQTAVEWFNEQIKLNSEFRENFKGRVSFTIGLSKIDELYNQAKEMEKNDTDNKVIHFAEWLTNKHTTTLITLYEQFEEQYYNETFKSE